MVMMPPWERRNDGRNSLSLARFNAVSRDALALVRDKSSSADPHQQHLRLQHVIREEGLRHGGRVCQARGLLSRMRPEASPSASRHHFTCEMRHNDHAVKRWCLLEMSSSRCSWNPELQQLQFSHLHPLDSRPEPWIKSPRT